MDGREHWVDAGSIWELELPVAAAHHVEPVVRKNCGALSVPVQVDAIPAAILELPDEDVQVAVPVHVIDGGGQAALLPQRDAAVRESEGEGPGEVDQMGGAVELGEQGARRGQKVKERPGENRKWIGSTS